MVPFGPPRLTAPRSPPRSLSSSPAYRPNNTPKACTMDGDAEIVPGVLYLHYTTTPQVPAASIPDGSLYYHCDDDIVYEPFCADFGPCNLAQTWRFCQRMNHLVSRAEEENKMAYLVTGPHPHKRANVAVLTGIYMVLYMDMPASRAYEVIRHLEPFCGFRDASNGPPMYTLGVEEVLMGMDRAKKVGFINWHKGEVFDADAYEHYEQVENGDLNWIVPGKFLAFAGPYGESKNFGGWRTFTPEDYVGYFKENGITSVVRLNKRMYDGQRFADHGIAHHDLYFPDGTCPTDRILERFLEIAETETGALAVHCKAGLGRTGVLICCYMMKHYGFTAEEAMGWIRVARPGSVLGPQQHYLLHKHAVMKANLEMMRARETESGASVSISSLSVGEGESKGRRVINLVASCASVDGSNMDPQHVFSSRRDSDTSHPIPLNHSSSSMQERKPPSFNIHVDARAGIATPEKATKLAPMPSLVSADSGTCGHGGSLPGSLQSTPTQAPRAKVVPPSSTKRVTAPNGQPRKIPLAVDFNDRSALEDMDAKDFLAHKSGATVDSVARLRTDSEDWSVPSGVVEPDHQGAGSVGAFAAAAGRGASAFVEAFRSVVGAHRSQYRANGKP